MLDLINLMEAQKYMGVANVALPPSAEQEQQQQAIQVQQKVAKLKVGFMKAIVLCYSKACKLHIAGVALVHHAC